MQSRVRKILHSESDHEAVQNQLSNDFEVCEYLKENKLDSHNIEFYAKLLNSLIVGQDERKNKLKQLALAHSEYDEKSMEKAQRTPIESFEDTLETIQERTCKEMEVKRDLDREIVETKKSLNLLKGDIGHLVSRNESTELLSSKIVKVKIVAEDQLKRVTMALCKDKEEIKLRNDMQKKFSKKLKNVSGYEENSLNRTKKNFAHAVLKKQEIFDKLASTQKVAQETEQIIQLKSLKQQKDSQNLQMLQKLIDLAAVTKQFSPSIASKQQQNAQTLQQAIINYAQSLPPLAGNTIQIEKIDLDSIVEDILEENYRLKQSIKAQTCFYNELLKTKVDVQQKMEELNKQEQQLIRKFQQEAQENYKIGDSERRSFINKFKKYNELIKTYYGLLSYLEKNYNFQPKKFKQTYRNIMTDKDQILMRRSSSSQKNYYTCYITEFHRINQFLQLEEASDEFTYLMDREDEQIEEFFDGLLNDVELWLMEIKRKISFQYLEEVVKRKKTHSQRKSTFYLPGRQSHSRQDSATFQEEQITKEVQKEEIDTLQHSHSAHISKEQQKERRSSNKGQIKAKRIKLLENVDADYYKMIKSTIKMEKENTRKNYQFQRTFKRTKYCSRDNILEEKRFEASFSVLFTRQSSPNLQKVANKNESRHSGFNKVIPAEYKKYSMGCFSPQQNSKFLRKSVLQPGQLRPRFTEKLKQALSYDLDFS